MTREMKDSGIEWIGEIPKDWSLTKVKNIFTTHKEIVGDNEDRYERLSLTLNGVLKRSKNDNKGLQSNDLSTYQILYKDELVFKMIDLANISTSRVGYSNYTGIVSPVYIILKNDNYSKYGYYYFYNMWQRNIFNQLGNNGVRSALNSKDMLMLPFPHIKLNEANAICKFLDSKIHEIDNTIALAKASIEDYKKYKQSIITKAVTKGLNPDVEMKDSGIEWIGKIPNNYKITSVKMLYNIVLGKMLCNTPKYNDDTLENYICAQNIKWTGLNTSLIKKMWFTTEEKKLYKLEIGDLLITEGGSVGVSCLYDGKSDPCYIQNAVHRARGKNGNLNKYLYYWLFALEAYGYFEMVCSKATIAHYTKEKVENTPILYIPIEEQQQIVDYLDQQCEQIDKMIADKEALIKDLEGYKKSLIYEYVTGKKEVK